MIKIKSADRRGLTKIDWLTSYHIFSFNNFFDPESINFGPIRVLNDDIIEPSSGFPAHPHKDMEIITIVIEGALTHEDSTGTKETVTFGRIQKMSAGTGIYHSEYNNSAVEPVRLMQIWIIPEQRGLKPSYQTQNFDLTKTNELIKTASGKKNENVIFINRDIELYYLHLSNNKITYQIPPDRSIYIYLFDGEINLNNNTLKEGFSAEINDEKEIMLQSSASARLLLFNFSVKEL